MSSIPREDVDKARKLFRGNHDVNRRDQFGILGFGGVPVTTGKADIGTVVAFAAGLATINDPWRDLVTWYRDFRVTDARYRLVSGALPAGAG